MVELEESKFFKAIASPVRLRIIRSLDKQNLSYTELMRAVDMAKKRDSGRFAHHMHVLISSGLVRLNERTKTYELTPLGSQLVKSLENIRSALFSAGSFKVRRSGLFIERFDKNRITRVLVDEAGIPPKTADKLARLAEEKLESLKIEYLTAPLIRELVNVLLIEHGLEEYRHRLIRLGMPFNDVEELLDEASAKHSFQLLVKRSSNAVFREYVLHSALPREVVDAYLLGDIDLYHIDTWPFSISAKIYNAEPDQMIDVLSKVDGIEDEIVLKISEPLENQFINFFLKQLSLKDIKVTVYSDETISAVIDADVNVTVPLEKLGLKNHRYIDVILAQRPASSDGHPFSSSGTIDGEASLNLVGLYLKSRQSEKVFWDNVDSAIETISKAFEKKKRMSSRFWGGLHGFFIVSFVGMQQLVKHAGINQVEMIKKILDICRALSTEEVMLLPSGQSTEKSAERLRRLDIMRFGAKPINQIVKSENYSWNITFQNIDEVLQMVRYLPGGLKITVSAGQAAKLYDLKPLAVLPSRP